MPGKGKKPITPKKRWNNGSLRPVVGGGFVLKSAKMAGIYSP
jgi:hypothetical protein